MNGTKRYRATLRLGIQTDTQDCEGRVIAESTTIPEDPRAISQAMLSFRGVIAQVPPMYSALKHRGTPLYKLARKGQTIERPARSIQIYDITPLAVAPPLVTFEVDCSPGTYIRTLCADIGQTLGCGAHLTSLNRLQNGHFGLDESLGLEEVVSLYERRALRERLVPLATAFSHLPLLTVTASLMALLRSRKSVLASQLKPAPALHPDGEGLIQVRCAGDPQHALVQPLASPKELSSIPDGQVAWKRVCFYNPQENTIH